MDRERPVWWYRIVYAIGFVCSLPYLFWLSVIKRKPQNVWKRLFPSMRPLSGSGPLLWAHAVSVGEVHAIVPVIAGLRAERPGLRVIVSTISHSGQLVARKVLPDAAAHLFLPFDFCYSVRRALRLGAPDLVLFSEGDVWPCFMNEARKKGAVIAIVNGKISAKSAGRMPRFFGRWLYSFVDLFCVQSEEMAERLLSVGALASAIHVTGNTKADVSFRFLTDEERESLRRSLGLNSSDRVVILGSTHEGEEEGIAARIEPILKQLGVRLIIVPRHPERFSQVYERMRSVFSAASKLSIYGGEPWDVMVVDRLGMLTSLYQIAAAAVVCGSFVEPIGGHNILEPAAAGVPTVVGPFMHSQQALFESALAASAVIQTTYETLPQTIAKLLNGPEAHASAATAARLWADSMRGATEKTVRLCQSVLRKSASGCS